MISLSPVNNFISFPLSFSLLRTIAMIGQSSEEKDEEKYFQERLKCLIDKGFLCFLRRI